MRRLRRGWVYPGVLARASGGIDLTAEVNGNRVFIRVKEREISDALIGKTGILRVTEPHRDRDWLFDGLLFRLAEGDDLQRLTTEGMPAGEFDASLSCVVSEPAEELTRPQAPPLPDRFTITFAGIDNGRLYGELDGYRVYPDSRRWTTSLPQVGETHLVDLVATHPHGRMVAYVELAVTPTPRGPISGTTSRRRPNEGRRVRDGFTKLPKRFIVRFTALRMNRPHAQVEGIDVYPDKRDWEAPEAEIGIDYVVEVVFQGRGQAFVKRAAAT